MPSSNVLKIAVFDLNQTVYNKSSKETFFKFVARKRKSKIFRLFEMGWYALQKELKLISKTEFKENFFNYLNHLPPLLAEDYAMEYWSGEWPQNFNQPLLEHIEKLRQSGVKIIFITGTLDVYVKPLFEHFLVPDHWIATRTQYIGHSYKVIGKACKDEEKVRRLHQLLQPAKYKITEAYSDKKEDILMAAQKAFLVKNGELILLNQLNHMLD